MVPLVKRVGETNPTATDTANDIVSELRSMYNVEQPFSFDQIQIIETKILRYLLTLSDAEVILDKFSVGSCGNSIKVEFSVMETHYRTIVVDLGIDWTIH